MPVSGTKRTGEFTARADLWLALVLSAVPVVSLWAFARLIRAEATVTAKLLLSLVLIAAAGFSLWCLFGTRYRVTPDALIVRAGPLRWRVPLDSIVEIAPDRNLLASASLSFERLRVRMAGGPPDLYLSPHDRKGFLECIEAACPALQRAGGRLIRRSSA